MNREQLEKFLKDPKCAGVVHHIPWVRLTEQDRERVIELLTSSDYQTDPETHLEIQEILDDYQYEIEELN